MRTASVAFVLFAFSMACDDKAVVDDTPTDETPSEPTPGGPQLRTGRLMGGQPVGGVRFQSATQSGLTDANGGFTYVDGEQVTFALGGTQLGSVAGAETVTPFTLQATVPPRTYSELYVTILNYGSSPAGRAFNMAVLFAMLDADGNLDNGIDLAGWDAALADASLDLNVEIWSLRERTLAPLQRYFGLNTLTIPVGVILSHLYTSLAVDVPATAISKLAVSAAGGASAYESTITYTNGRVSGFGDGSTLTRDAQGRVLVQTSGEYAQTQTYDARGALLTRSRAQTAIVYNNLECAYDAAQRLTSEVELREGTTVTRSYAYDLAARTVTETSAVNGEPTRTRVDTFDTHVRATTSTYDDTSDGTIDRTDVVTYTYDDAGRMLSDGTTTYTYESSGRALTYDFAHPTSPIRVELTYDAQGRVASALNSDGDTTTYTYDDAGNIVTIAYDDQVSSFTYDAEGSIATSTSSQGAVTTYSYTAAPNNLETLLLLFFDGYCTSCFW